MSCFFSVFVLFVYNSICWCILCSYSVSLVVFILFFFFFKQKTAYEMRISDWSSDVCSSDLTQGQGRGGLSRRVGPHRLRRCVTRRRSRILRTLEKIGRASCRERVCQYV